MQMRKDAWHRRLVERMMGEEYFTKVRLSTEFPFEVRVNKNVSLCKYFWTVVLCCQTFVFWLFGRWLHAHWPKSHYKAPRVHLSDKAKSLIIFGVIGAAITAGLVYNWAYTIAILIIIGIIVGAIIGGIVAIRFIVDHWPERKPRPKRIKPKKVKEYVYKPPKEHKPNMTWEMLKAWKQKVCPLIEFTDE